MYHINLQGQVHPCTAEIACRFGSFESDHYTTAEQARAAYEASMKGKTVATFKKKQAHFEVLSEEQKAAAKQRATRLKYLQSLETPRTQIPPKPEEGHYSTITGPDRLRVGDVLPDGRRVTSFDWTDEHGTMVALREPEKSKSKKVPMSTLDLADVKVWRKEPHPELVAAYEAAKAERTIEDSALNFLKPRSKFSNLLTAGLIYRGYSAHYRAFRKNLGELQKSGIALPYSRALEATLSSYPGSVTGLSGERARDLFNAVATQKSSVLLRIMGDQPREVFPEGETPFLDFQFSELNNERRAAGLL